MADPSQTPQNGHFHAVRFYKDDANLCVVVADFLREGLVSMQPALVIASPEHRLQLAAKLQEYDLTSRCWRQPVICSSWMQTPC